VKNSTNVIFETRYVHMSHVDAP